MDVNGLTVPGREGADDLPSGPESFMDRMIALIEGAERQKTPNEIALNILLSALTIVFLLVVLALQPMAGYAGAAQSTTVLVALLVTLIPTTIGALLSAIGIAGMDRLVQRNVVALSGRTVLVTGATSGIGYQTARLLAERGAMVLVHGRTAEEAHAAVDRLATLSDAPADSLCAVGADFSRLEEVEQLAVRVLTEHPHLDVLVNNASPTLPP